MNGSELCNITFMINLKCLENDTLTVPDLYFEAFFAASIAICLKSVGALLFRNCSASFKSSDFEAPLRVDSPSVNVRSSYILKIKFEYACKEHGIRNVPEE
jgi:hypothetical protein